MSKRVDVSIRCPICGHEQDAVLFRTIWAENPENLSLILNDQINVFRCDNCEYKDRIAYPFLCTNVKKQIAIWYEPYHDARIDADAKDFAEHVGPNSFYAKAPRIADWAEFKSRLLQMEAAGCQPGQEVKKSTFLQYATQAADIDRKQRSLQTMLSNFGSRLFRRR